MKEQDAAQRIGFSRTTLKNWLKEHNIGRWPGRKIRSHQKQIELIDSRLRVETDPTKYYQLVGERKEFLGRIDEVRRDALTRYQMSLRNSPRMRRQQERLVTERGVPPPPTGPLMGGPGPTRPGGPGGPGGFAMGPFVSTAPIVPVSLHAHAPHSARNHRHRSFASPYRVSMALHGGVRPMRHPQRPFDSGMRFGMTPVIGRGYFPQQAHGQGPGGHRHPHPHGPHGHPSHGHGVPGPVFSHPRFITNSIHPQPQRIPGPAMQRPLIGGGPHHHHHHHHNVPPAPPAPPAPAPIVSYQRPPNPSQIGIGTETQHPYPYPHIHPYTPRRSASLEVETDRPSPRSPRTSNLPTPRRMRPTLQKPFPPHLYNTSQSQKELSPRAAAARGKIPSFKQLMQRLAQRNGNRHMVDVEGDTQMIDDM